MSDGPSMEQIRKTVDSLEPLAFRKIDDVKKLAVHFQQIISNPITQVSPKIKKYLISLDDRNRRRFLQKREVAEVEYIYPSDTKDNQQRQRFNSLSITEVSDLLKQEFAKSDDSIKVHICTECNVEIEANGDEPLVESLQRHFSLDIHKPKRPEPCDVSEPIVLPNLSRRKSAMVERGESVAPPTTMERLEQLMNENLTTKQERPEKRFMAKLETFLVRHLPDNSESCLNAAVNFYNGVYDHLCKEISTVNLASLANMVSPIIVSIKDNVHQHIVIENKPDDEAEDRAKMKKMRYYGQIEQEICKTLSKHKLLTLIDDRTAKPAFFCIACEYYTLRFRYDSVLNHVFSEMHVHNLANILDADKTIPFTVAQTSLIDEIHELNRSLLLAFGVEISDLAGSCALCKVKFDKEQIVGHILDDGHLGRLSDANFEAFRGRNDSVPADWGQKCLEWSKHLASTGKVNLSQDNVIVENFIKSMGKLVNHCPSCNMSLKGPRQVLFSHVRQKKHLRNVAPEKLQYLYKNYCRPVEYYASFGKYFLCAICPDVKAVTSFASVVGHVESDSHMESIAKLIRTAVAYDESCTEILKQNGVVNLKCAICDINFPSSKEAVMHITELKHADSFAEEKNQIDKKDLISVYMNGNYILYTQSASFTCTICKGIFGSIRSLLMHLVYADHFQHRPTSENVFRFYLELKHNIGLIIRNKYSHLEFGALYCGSCERYLEAGENAKRHTTVPSHRERFSGTLEQPQEEF